jgi:hypothetical protein
MTRETKAGLIVSCSFLCLVGVVLFSKLTEREDTTGATDGMDSQQADASTSSRQKSDQEMGEPGNSDGRLVKGPAENASGKVEKAPRLLPTSFTSSDIQPEAKTAVSSSQQPAKATSSAAEEKAIVDKNLPKEGAVSESLLPWEQGSMNKNAAKTSNTAGALTTNPKEAEKKLGEGAGSKNSWSSPGPVSEEKATSAKNAVAAISGAGANPGAEKAAKDANASPLGTDAAKASVEEKKSKETPPWSWQREEKKSSEAEAAKTASSNVPAIDANKEAENSKTKTGTFGGPSTGPGANPEKKLAAEGPAKPPPLGMPNEEKREPEKASNAAAESASSSSPMGEKKAGITNSTWPPPLASPAIKPASERGSKETLVNGSNDETGTKREDRNGTQSGSPSLSVQGSESKSEPPKSLLSIPPQSLASRRETTPEGIKDQAKAGSVADDTAKARDVSKPQSEVATKTGQTNKEQGKGGSVADNAAKTADVSNPQLKMETKTGQTTPVLSLPGSPPVPALETKPKLEQSNSRNPPITAPGPSAPEPGGKTSGLSESVPSLSPPSSPIGGPPAGVPALSNSDSGNRPAKIVMPSPVALLGNDASGQGSGGTSSRTPGLSSAPDSQPDKNTQTSVRGVVPSASAPPGASAPSGGPRTGGTPPLVESYDEEMYVSKPNDTFRSISLEFYRQDYERALYLFNRNHPLADANLKDDPRLKVGQAVYIPPAWILEKYYSAAVSKKEPEPSTGANVLSEKVEAGRPAVVTPTPAGPKEKVPPPAPERLYRVAANGEWIWNIAVRTLGKGERWVDIYQLNPGLKTEALIPGGRELRLPADARWEPPSHP